MKEYRLLSWPELPSAFDRTGHRRMLSDMSHRYMSLAQLTSISGLRRPEVQQFLDMLDARSLLTDRDLTAPDSLIMETLRPLGGWLRRTFGGSADRPL